MILGSNPLLIPTGNQVHICKVIYVAMNQNPFLHLFWEVQIISSFHIVAHEISYNDVLIVSG